MENAGIERFAYILFQFLTSNNSDGISAILENPPISQLDEQPVLPNIQTEIQYPGMSNKGKIQIRPSVSTVLSRGPIGELERVTERESKERRRSRSRSRERSLVFDGSYPLFIC